MMRKCVLFLAAGSGLLMASLHALAAAPVVPQSPEPSPDAELQVIKVQGNVWMIAGAGGNIAVQVGPQGIVLVDTGVVGVTDKVMAAVRTLSDKPLRYIINTSIAPGHVGGNARLATLPGGVLTGNARGATPGVIAQENVFNRMGRAGPDGKPLFPSAAWPTDGYFAPRRGFTFNGEAIDVIHLPNAHSDGDSAVYFRGSNVLVAGDVFTTTSLPLVNVALGGTLTGVLEGLNALLDITIPDDLAEGGTYVIPGHGRICDEADLVEYRDMVQVVRDRMLRLAAEGKTVAQAKAARPVIGWEARYSQPGWTTEKFIESVYPEFLSPAASRGSR